MDAPSFNRMNNQQDSSGVRRLFDARGEISFPPKMHLSGKNFWWLFFYWFRQKFPHDLSDPPGFHNFCWPSFTDLQKFPQDLSDAPRVFKFLMTFFTRLHKLFLGLSDPPGNLRTPICTPLEDSSWTPTYIESVSIIMLSIIPCRVCCRIRRTLTIRTGTNQSFWDPRTKQHHWPTRFIGSIAQLSLPTVDNREKAPGSCSNGLQQFNSAACRGTLAVSDL